MFDPTRPDINRNKLYDFLNMDRIVLSMLDDIQSVYVQNLSILNKLSDELESNDVEDVRSLENHIENLKLNIAKEKAVIDQLKTKQAREIIRNIAYEEFSQISSGNEEEDFNLAESIHRIAKITDNTVKRFTQLHKDMLK